MVAIARLRRFVAWPVAVAVVAAAGVVATRVDFAPRVESDFFFATDDPALDATRAIAARFPSGPQVYLRVAGESVLDGDYLERLGELGDALAGVEGVASLRSLLRGPSSPASVVVSPAWSRLLLSRPPAERPRAGEEEPEAPRASLVVLELGGDDDGETVRAIAAIAAERTRPSFRIDASGVPVVVESIRRHLRRDLRVFSLAALLVFGLTLAAVYRSPWIVGGTLSTGLAAVVATLALLHAVGSGIGLLTANLSTLVFVLALAHTVFLTAQHRRLADDGDGAAAVDRAVEATFPASFWSMATTLFGFGSLLFASAKPLRELGLAGSVGTATAIVVAYALFPLFLRRARRRTSAGPGLGLATGGGWVALAALASVVAATAFGLPRLDTDPGLLAYFDPRGDVYPALARIDSEGGSSPLHLVVRDPHGGRLDTKDGLERLGRLQAAIESEPGVGVALSLPVLVEEARRTPFVIFLGSGQVVDLLTGETTGGVGRRFVTDDRREAAFSLRMHEAGRDEPRRAIVGRLRAAAREAGLEVVAVGGLYELQDRLGRLVTASLAGGLGGLLALFALVAVVVARELRVAAAMIAVLAAVPVVLLGAVGLLGVPLDLIASPAPNVAIAVGIDSMIHLVVAVRRRRAAGRNEAEAWSSAGRELGPAIAGAALVLAAGFGVFALSSFPPTRRFGIVVAAGAVLAATSALTVLPRLARRGEV